MRFTKTLFTLACTIGFLASYCQDKKNIPISENLIIKIRDSPCISKKDLTSEIEIEENYTESTYELMPRDTSIIINDSIFFSIISFKDSSGRCIRKYYIIVNKTSKIVSFHGGLMTQCNIIDSTNGYQTTDYEILNNNTIVIKMIIVRKNSLNEKSNAPTFEREIMKGYMTIEEDGKFVISTVPPNK